jgi:hypothetical protein
MVRNPTFPSQEGNKFRTWEGVFLIRSIFLHLKKTAFNNIHKNSVKVVSLPALGNFIPLKIRQRLAQGSLGVFDVSRSED